MSNVMSHAESLNINELIRLAFDVESPDEESAEAQPADSAEEQQDEPIDLNELFELVYAPGTSQDHATAA